MLTGFDRARGLLRRLTGWGCEMGKRRWFLTGLWCGLTLLAVWFALPLSSSASSHKSLFLRTVQCDPGTGRVVGRSFRHTNIRFEFQALKIDGAQLTCKDAGVVEFLLVEPEDGSGMNRARGRVYLVHPSRELPYQAWVEFKCRVVLE